MNVDGSPFRTIWEEDGSVRIIDQTRLPHEFRVVELPDLGAVATAIVTMQVRGAPLIGATAGYGMALGIRDDATDDGVSRARDTLLATRPTAVNLRWAVDRMVEHLLPLPTEARERAAFRLAARICNEDVETNRRLGSHAFRLLEELHRRKRAAPAGEAGRAGGADRAGEAGGAGQEDPGDDGPGEVRLNVLTHCNAGWLATVDRGTATAGIYHAHEEGLPLHVWVDETRPRGQGARLTAWELGQQGVPHTVVPDTAAAHLMARGDVDVVLVGTDRTTASGDVANKVGTYAVALAAKDNGVPFYVAAPGSSIDFTLRDGEDVPIEERSPDEVAWVSGRDAGGTVHRVRVLPEGSPALNYAFDLTPARLVTGIVTERGVAPPTEDGLAHLFPERAEGAERADRGERAQQNEGALAEGRDGPE